MMYRDEEVSVFESTGSWLRPSIATIAFLAFQQMKLQLEITYMYCDFASLGWWFSQPWHSPVKTSLGSATNSAAASTISITTSTSLVDFGG